jgi:transketolase
VKIGERAGLRQSKPLRDVFGDAILNLAAENERVVVLDGDLGNSTKAETVRNKFPERFFNIGIAESNLACIGAGFAANNFIPYIVSFSSFLLCNAYDQIRLSIALSNCNAKVVGSHGGITLGKDGPTQMGIEDFALVGGMPTFVMLVPSDPVSMHWAVKAAADHIGPVFLRSSRVSMPYIYDEDESFEIGRAKTLREGSDLTIIGCGLMTTLSLDAAAQLADEGIEAAVVDMHTLRPMDQDAIVDAAKTTGAIVTAEEHLLTGGMGSNIARIVSENAPVPMRFVGLADTYVESAAPEDLLVKYHLTASDICVASREVLKAKGG